MFQLSKEMIAAICKDTERLFGLETTVGEHIAKQFDAIYATEHAHRVASEKLRREKARHADAVAAITAEITAVQKACKHPHAQRHADPAGGSDSFHSCEICGAQW